MNAAPTYTLVDMPYRKPYRMLLTDDGEFYLSFRAFDEPPTDPLLLVSTFDDCAFLIRSRLIFCLPDLSRPLHKALLDATEICVTEFVGSAWKDQTAPEFVRRYISKVRRLRDTDTEENGNPITWRAEHLPDIDPIPRVIQ
jgi:hypothetical protein